MSLSNLYNIGKQYIVHDFYILITFLNYVLVKAEKEQAEKMQMEKEEQSKADKTSTGPSTKTAKKVQHPTWLRKKEYKKYIKSYRKQQSINAKRLKKSAKK